MKEYLNDLILKEKKDHDETEDDIEYEKIVEEEAGRLLRQNLPHYIWVLEVDNGNGKRSLVLADPTLNSATRKNILLSSVVFTVTEGFSLLNDFD